jgi:hypothetical protein
MRNPCPYQPGSCPAVRRSYSSLSTEAKNLDFSFYLEVMRCTTFSDK